MSRAPAAPGSRRGAPLCACCDYFPAVRRIGFPSHPQALPGLPESLRGKAIPVCEDPACAELAQTRAIRAADAAGFVLTATFTETL